MAGRTREMMIGVFVTVGLLVGIGAVVWLGAAADLRGGKSYVAYFDQSVGTIADGSQVRYLGLEIGTVTGIAVSPDPTLMAVTMKITRPDLVTPRTVAELASLGFTGVGFVELSPAAKPVQAPSFAFQPPLPVIPTRRSAGFSAVIADAKRIADKIEALDLKGVVDDLRAAASSARDLTGGPDLKRTVASLAAASGRLEDITARVDRMVASEEFRRLPADAAGVLQQARNTIARAREQIEALQLAETSRRVNRVVGSVDDSTQVITAQVEELLQDLRQASDSLNRLLERLGENPSELLFSKPAPRRNER